VADTHLYLSLIPEALIGSMLPPEAFGSYYAVGMQSHVRGEAIFFELDPGYRSDDFPFHLLDERLVVQPNGAPKRSVYLSIHRVLERIPVSALGRLYLVTSDGRTLGLDRADYLPDPVEQLHLYQEFCPVTPLVASRLGPLELCRALTDPDHPIHVPRLVFSELHLGELATDPLRGAAHDLPYSNMAHLRDVLYEMKLNRTKAAKLVLKQVKEGVLYRMIKGGFYVGDQSEFAFYRFPDLDELENEHHNWWRSAQVTALE